MILAYKLVCHHLPTAHLFIVREPNPNFFNSVAPERVKAMDPSNI